MAIELDMGSGEFGQRFETLLDAKRESAADVDAAVAVIIDDVRARGDEALAEFSLRFDRVNLRAKGIAVGADEIEAAVAACEPAALKALELAHERVTAYHARQKPDDVRFADALGVELGWRWRPIETVGLYVPGGAASYPSSVVMNAVPAGRGLPSAGDGRPHPGRMRQSAGAGGRPHRGDRRDLPDRRLQAIAALAYGTETIVPVAKIVGPGNAYVAAAKRRVFGVVGIDMIAGPSEVVILADATADPRFVAADLLAQAEHDAAAQSILFTDDVTLARSVAAEVERQLAELPREEIAAASWRGMARSSSVRRWRQHCRSSTGSRRNIWKSWPETPKCSRRKSTTPAPYSSDPLRRRPSATMSAGRTMCCRLPVQRVSPRGSECSIS